MQQRVYQKDTSKRYEKNMRNSKAKDLCYKAMWWIEAMKLHDLDNFMYYIYLNISWA